MGRYFDGFSLSRLAFLRRGVTRECLKTIGKLPEESERLIILVITGTRAEEQSFRREVGIRQSRRKIPHADGSLQKTFNSCHWRSPTRLERRTEDVPRWLLLPLHEVRIRVDRGIVGCEEHTEISSMILGLRR